MTVHLIYRIDQSFELTNYQFNTFLKVNSMITSAFVKPDCIFVPQNIKFYIKMRNFD